MSTLFRIKTDRVALSWGRARGTDPAPFPQSLAQLGRLHIIPLRQGVTFGQETWRSAVPGAIAHDAEISAGPRLYEQTDYRVYVRAEGSSRVRIEHRDPLIVRELVSEEDGQVVHGNVNFGSQVGRSLFSVIVDNRPEFDFEIEVFPTKLDYETDYRQLLADVQDELSGLVLEYLRSTYHSGFMSREPKPSQLEWLVLLRHVLDTLDGALQQIARRPIRGMQRRPVVTRVDRIRRLDHTVRQAIQRGSGRGPLVQLGSGRYVRERIVESQTRTTLDTPEHRWLSAQIDSVRRRLGWLRHAELACERTERRDHVIHELTVMESKISRLGRLEPFVEATGAAPSGFASLQLLGAPGYREAYLAVLILSLGLRIEGGPLQLSVKDLSLLYEYWCYLALLRIVSQETGLPIPAKDFLSVSRRGVHVRLQKGRETAARFQGPSGRCITVTYNRLFRDTSADKVILVPQQPDIVVSVEEPNWPQLHLLIDAKYRLDASREYVNRYGTPGPPEDAINVLHRYRDAILERVPGSPLDGRPQRTVVEAAATFPYRETASGDFESSSLWRALDRLGIGAIPLLPGATGYVRRWLRSALRRGGWSMADHAIAHRAAEKSRDWRVAAAEPVLVGVLRGDDPREHLDWIFRTRMYYLKLSKQHGRQLVARWVAVYSPAQLGGPGAITHLAPVLDIDVRARGKIDTPWSSKRNSEELQAVYLLGEVRPMPRPIANREADGPAQPIRQHRWTTRLALERAHHLKELGLETEPEWRLYEDLLACGLTFRIKWGQLGALSAEDPLGRAWFEIAGGPRIRYAGASGFQVQSRSGESVYMPSGETVLRQLDLVPGQ